MEKEADVVVAGGGLAGLWAAIRATDFTRKVVLVEKGKVTRSGVSVFCHTTVAPVPPGQHNEYLEELVHRSTYLADQELLEIFLRENGERIKQMIGWGVEFERRPDGSLRTEAVRGQKITLSALYFGRQMMKKMKEEAIRRGVQIEERVMVTDLLTSDGKLPTGGEVVGVAGFQTRSGDFVVYRARGIVLSTGAMSTRTNILYTNGLSGDGHAMAFRAGAELVNMELAVSNSFGVWNRKFATGGQQQFLMNNSRIVNRLGERIMERYTTAASVNNPEFDGHVEFGDICRAIAIENLEGRGPCYFDLSGWSQGNVEKMRKILPTTMAAFEDLGIDIRRERIESTPITVTYCGGNQAGLRINSRFETTLPGLYAAGVTAFVAGGLLPQGFCNVSGYRAGEHAAIRALQSAPKPPVKEQVENIRQRAAAWLRRESHTSADALYLNLNKVLAPYGAGFFKSEKRIKATLGELEKMEKELLSHACTKDTHELVKLHELQNVLTVLRVIYTAALERKESRFGHYREEYPYRDDLNWLKWIVTRNDRKGGISLRVEPVPFEDYPIKPEKRDRIASATQYSVRP